MMLYYSSQGCGEQGSAWVLMGNQFCCDALCVLTAVDHEQCPVFFYLSIMLWLLGVRNSLCNAGEFKCRAKLHILQNDHTVDSTHL